MLDEDTIHLTKTVTELKRQGDAAMATGQLTKAAVTYTQAVEMDGTTTPVSSDAVCSRSTVLHNLGAKQTLLWICNAALMSKVRRLS